MNNPVYDFKKLPALPNKANYYIGTSIGKKGAFNFYMITKSVVDHANLGEFLVDLNIVKDYKFTGTPYGEYHWIDLAPNLTVKVLYDEDEFADHEKQVKDEIAKEVVNFKTWLFDQVRDRITPDQFYRILEYIDAKYKNKFPIYSKEFLNAVMEIVDIIRLK